MPLYPAFIAAIVRLTDSVLLLVLAHLAVSMVAYYLFYRLILLVWGRKVAWWSLWLFVLEPFSIYQSGVFYSEMLFLVFFFSALIFFFKYVLGFRESQHFSSPRRGGERKNKASDVRGSSGWLSYVVWCGVFLGLSILTRPVAQFSIVIFVFGVVLAALVQRRSWRYLVAAPVMLIACMLLVIGPWVVRNYYHYKVPQLSFLSGYTFYLYNVGDFLSSKTQAFTTLGGRDAMRNQLREQFQQAINDTSIPRIDEDVSPLIRYTNEFYKKGYELIGQDWLGYIKYQTLFTSSAMLNEGYRDILNVAGVRGFEQSHYLTKLVKPHRLQPPLFADSNVAANAFLLVAEIVWIAVYILIAAGLVRLLVWRNWRSLFIAAFFLLMVVYFNTAAGSLSSGRYHFPSVPFIIALAVYSVYCQRRPMLPLVRGSERGS